MMKGYLTLFLSLSLSSLIGFTLFLTGNAVRNAGKVRLECASDIGMNSALAEFSVALQERYDLFYVDTSYLGNHPSISNLEDRLDYYIRSNLNRYQDRKPWVNIELNRVSISEPVVAAKGQGSSMKYQAAKYIEDCGITREEAEIFPYLGTVHRLNENDVMGKWAALQEQIAGIELPEVLNEKGELIKVPLENPGDRIYGYTGSDSLYLLDLNLAKIGAGRIRKENYISGRTVENTGGFYDKTAENSFFLTYLFEKMGNYGRIREDSLLCFQLEYIAMGEASDYENLKAVADKLISWRFAVNAAAIQESGSMYGEAENLAKSLQAVQLKKEFEQPVTCSILYAWAYLESVSEVKSLLSGGKVELAKNSWHTGIEQVISGELPSCFEGDTGLSYEQYLGCMLMLLAEEERNLRTMDIMEMDIRSLTGNPGFCMDFCVERFRAEIFAQGMMEEKYVFSRTYGYY